MVCSIFEPKETSLAFAQKKVLTFCQPGWLAGMHPPCNKSLLTFWLVRGLLPALPDYPSSHKRGLFTFIYIAHCDVNQISKRPCIIDIFLSLQWFVKYLHPFKHETVIDTDTLFAICVFVWYLLKILCTVFVWYLPVRAHTDTHPPSEPHWQVSWDETLWYHPVPRYPTLLS